MVSTLVPVLTVIVPESLKLAVEATDKEVALEDKVLVVFVYTGTVLVSYLAGKLPERM
jgi:hypothetical protein